jgi:predicted transglutaminase-like cysteine proteinase
MSCAPHRNISLITAALASVCALAPQSARAADFADVTSEALRGLNCPSASSAALIDFAALAPASQSAKSAAILGGQPSALELTRLAQEGSPSSQAATTATVATAQGLSERLAPAASGMRGSGSCSETNSQQPPTGFSSENFLASKRLRIGHTAFDTEWRRVKDDRISTIRYGRLIGAAHNSLATMGSVNAWVNRKIAYTEDQMLFGRADYWAGARKTLRLGRGDCEDIALTKMQLLAAAGVPRENMILTIARDLVRNADHAVLIVLHDGRYYMLDNATDEVLDASTSHDYRPILSLGSNQAWLHGY